MNEKAVIDLAAIAVLGIGSQWLAWRLKLPSILLLLVVGFVAGPVTGFLQPDDLFGEVLFPVVSISVAVILFEGGLGLHFSELRGGLQRPVRRLITLGVLVTFVIGTLAARLLFAFNWQMAALLAAILVVSGPTVVLPLLKHIQPTDRVGSILKWEGILIDPVGATLAVLVFETILVSGFHEWSALTIAFDIVKTILIGSAAGILGALVIIWSFKRAWIPDFLQSAVTLMLLVLVFVASDHLQAESGLMAATVMGVALGNQSQVRVRHVALFNEELGLLLLSSLFILLSARLDLAQLRSVGWSALAFLAILIFIARPLGVALSTWGTNVSLRERLFLAWMAPRGIVAASVASLFSLSLAESGYPGAEQLVPLTFIVIAGSVTVYALTALPVARRLGVAQPNPQGVLFVGAQRWARAIAAAVQQAGLRVLLVDTNAANIRAAQAENIPAVQGSILDDELLRNLDLNGIGHLVALTSNDDLNSLAALKFTEVFDSQRVFQLPARLQKDGSLPKAAEHLRGRPLFGEGLDYDHLEELCAAGFQIEHIPLGRKAEGAALPPDSAAPSLPLFLIDKNERLTVASAAKPLEPNGGGQLIRLVHRA
jgi:NhaP-type Na+/H+ or K+/H+ antiporter